jgi:hypothetical protein
MGQREGTELRAYHDDGKENVAGGASLPGRMLRVDEEVDRDGDQDEAGGEIAGQCNVIDVNGIAGDYEEDADNEENAVNHRPPAKGREFIILFLHLGDDAGDEGDEPSQL